MTRSASLTKRQRISKCLDILEQSMPNAGPELEFSSDFQLLIAVILSAQTTDKQVNIATKSLFQIAPDAKTLSELSTSEIEEHIKTLGFFREKAKNIKKTATLIHENFGGIVPSDYESLESLPGVGRKTANVVRSVAFDIPAIAVDTHVFRLGKRLGISKATTPEKMELDLQKWIAKKRWSKAHHLLILHGRYVCRARKPECESCVLNELCPREI